MTSNPPFGGQPQPPPDYGGDGQPQRAPGYGSAPGSFIPPGSPSPPSGDPAPGYGTPPGYAPPAAGGSSSWTPTGGDEISSGAPPPEGNTRSYIPWVIGLVVVLVLGGGAFAVRAALSGSADGPAGALPASAVIFARVDVDPSAAQKVQALRLATRFPAFGESTGITDAEVDLRSKLFEAMQADAPGLASMDYATDIEPWLGSKIGIAVFPAEGDAIEPGFALAIEVTDQAAAEEGIAKLLASGDGAETAGVAYTGSYAIFAMTQDLADGYVAAAEESALTDNEEFQTDMSALGDEGVASAWVSADAYTMFNELGAGLGGMVPGAGLDGASAPLVPGGAGGPQIPFQSGSAAYALRFDDRFIEVAMVGSGSDLNASSSDTESPIVALPDTTLFAMSVANGGEYVQQGLDQLAAIAEQTGQNFDREINRFERQTGLAVPDDFVTLLGDHFALAVDSELGSPDDPASLRIGAVLDTDAAAAQAVIDKIVQAAGDGVELATVESDGLLSVALNEAYAGELTGGSLGETDAFALAVADGADADLAFYFNIDELETLGLFTDRADSETLANIAPLEAVGFSAQFTGDGDSRASFRITVNE